MSAFALISYCVRQGRGNVQSGGRRRRAAHNVRRQAAKGANALCVAHILHARPAGNQAARNEVAERVVRRRAAKNANRRRPLPHQNRKPSLRIFPLEIRNNRKGKRQKNLRTEIRRRKARPPHKLLVLGQRQGEALPFAMENTQADGAKNGALRVAITKETPLLNQIHVYVKDIKLEADKAYTVKFRIKTSGEFAPMRYVYTLLDRADGRTRQSRPRRFRASSRR